MKYKHIIALFLVGIALQLFAALQKILHTPLADTFFKISVGCMILAIILGIIKLLNTKGKDHFLNS